MSEILKLATQLGDFLLQKKLMLVTAESCTGGGIAHALTEIPGSSQWFDCGFVTYSNASKTQFLNVSERLLATYGAVSRETVSAMAEGARVVRNVQISLSTTGIAGPSGATPTKPVGTVYFGFASPHHTHTDHCLFSGDRHTVREKSVHHAIKTLHDFLLQEYPKEPLIK